MDIPKERFDEILARMRARGLTVHAINHGADKPFAAEPDDKTWIRSMYFRDPNGIHLEFAALTRAYDEHDVRHDPVNAKGERVPLMNKERDLAR